MGHPSPPWTSARTPTCTATRACARCCRGAGRASGYHAVAGGLDLTEEWEEDATDSVLDALPDDTFMNTLPIRKARLICSATRPGRCSGGSKPGYRRRRHPLIMDPHPLEFRVRQHDGPVQCRRRRPRAALGLPRTSPTSPTSWFCRALNIPARYVFGYLPDLDVPPDPAPMDFAAWMEASRGWATPPAWTFDPRNNTKGKGCIVIGRGRDASDVAMATTFGLSLLESMWSRVSRDSTGEGTL